jgi:hypothetical protein
MVKVYSFEIGDILTGENRVQEHKSTRGRIAHIGGRILQETEEEVPACAIHEGKYDVEACLKTKAGWIHHWHILSIDQRKDDPDLFDVHYRLGQGRHPTTAKQDDVEVFLTKHSGGVER